MTRRSPSHHPHAPAAEGPAWFDPARHFIGTFGIHDRTTGALLDAAGEPASPAVRRLGTTSAATSAQED
jgi:hypothetical protein